MKRYTAKVRQEFQEKNGITYAEYIKQWQQDNYSKFYETRTKYRLANPQKHNAQVLACRRFPTRELCSVNGCQNLGERHHPDYSKPYEIVWLCRYHHKSLHASML